MINMIPVLLGLVLVLTLFLVFFYFGTSVRRTSNSVVFGFCTYSADQIMKCEFNVISEDYRPPHSSFRLRWRVRVEVYDGKKYIRTHYLNVRNRKAADKLALKVEKLLQEAKYEEL